MTDLPEPPKIIWPDEIWAENHGDHGVEICWASQHAAIASGVPIARYVHGNILETQKRYYEEMLRQLRAERDEAINANQVSRTIKPLNWSEDREPNGRDCYEDHCLADSAIGQYKIEWKSWKDGEDGTGSRCVFLNCDFIAVGDTTDEAKKIADDHYASIISSALI